MSLSLIGNFSNFGTITANGTSSSLAQANTNIQRNSIVLFSLRTQGGTGPAGNPYLSVITPGVSFSIKAGAGDTSVYNYFILNL